jgi:ABC-type amino acid transport system permease subunit
MTKTAALVLSALMTLATVAGMNGIAKTQYAAADTLAMANVDVQHVTIVGHRADA